MRWAACWSKAVCAGSRVSKAAKSPATTSRVKVLVMISLLAAVVDDANSLFSWCGCLLLQGVQVDFGSYPGVKIAFPVPAAWR